MRQLLVPFLVRVGIDSSDDGHWNGPADPESLRFGYVPIVETKFVRQGMERSYDELCPPRPLLSLILGTIIYMMVIPRWPIAR